jgi:sugar (pentulose or hexulose) kinase
MSEDSSSRVAPEDSLDQIFISYHPAEDRLLVKLGTLGRAEVQLWLTRRVARQVWAVLIALVESDDALLSLSDSNGSGTLLAFRHEQALAQSAFSRDGAEATSYPLGDAPLLITRLTLKRDRAPPTLQFADASGRSVGFPVSLQLAHSVARLFADTVAKSDWDLDLKIGGRGETGAAIN